MNPRPRLALLTQPLALPTRPLALWAVLAASGCEEVPRTYSTRAEDGVVLFRDDFERDELGPDWHVTGPGASLERGVLVIEDLHNHPLWLTHPLPDDVRVEFDARATTEEGDIKVELCGDGKSRATSMNYVATGYVVIFGGWNNTLNAIVRNNEHGRQRETSSEPKVEPGQRYHFSITRSGNELRWEIDGREVLSYEDDAPLRGPGHDHFAFSGWEAQTHFDNLVIEAL
ncbi:hypothetical protein [Paraliomyxa miuraensis]|uniref:hypothetical protein n=1 Tax=Paraliomyxa miuraensis TaxID=376150 RepID=UPI00224F776D|nr:hypothetical protein [Paraliomyxa miuraensis]MCX4242324.1 hypothetical protein [Paraliomyxa miuraensis]